MKRRRQARSPKLTELIANPISNGWASLLAFAAIGGIGTAIYYARKTAGA